MLKLAVKGQEKSHILSLFPVENARIQLLETEELTENEQDEMGFLIEKAVKNDGDDDESDHEEEEVDDSDGWEDES